MGDTIAAIATAYGEGGIGIIRISGENSLNILNKLFVSKTKSAVKNRVMIYGNIIDPDTKGVIDEVLTVYMKAPHTYTAEDVVEIHCHGSVVSLRKVLSCVLRQGARLAEPGEFTKRAFLNGRIDLSQAEAVMDVIKAKTDKTFDVAMSQLEGKLSVKMNEVRKELLDLLVNVTVNIDYPDEDIEELNYEQFEENICSIKNKIEDMLNTADTGRIIREGLNVAIVGKPNVGKSSLMNALLRETRAIVTEIPGTTRDTIEEIISIKDIPIKLIDTAGIRETEDQIERIGIERSKESFNKADLVIFVLDSSRDLSREDEEIIQYIGNRKVIVLINKTDLGIKMDLESLREKIPNAVFVETSILEGEGIDQIETEIMNLVYGGKVKQNESIMVTNVRHKELLEQANDSLGDALNMVQAKEAMDFIEVDLRSAYERLGEIVGETVSEDIINEVFARFCLGK